MCPPFVTVGRNVVKIAPPLKVPSVSAFGGRAGIHDTLSRGCSSFWWLPMPVSFLVDGERVLIDQEDVLRVAEYKWHARRRAASRTYYVFAYMFNLNKTKLYLHRFILQAPPHLDVDHANLDGLDNRKSNLRLCTPLQNAWNRPKPLRNASGYRGVTWRKDCQLWQAKYSHGGRSHHVGYFETPEAAHAAWIDAVAPIRGDFLRTG